MERYYSKDSLQELNQKLLNGDYIEDYVNNYFLRLFDEPVFDQNELNTLILIACSFIKGTNYNFSPLTKLLIDQVYSRLVLEVLFPYKDSETCQNDCKNKDYKETSLDSQMWGQIKEENDKKEEISKEEKEVKEIFLNKYKEFKKSEYPELNFPKPGSTGVMRLKDNMTFPGETYYIQFEIDSEGKVLNMIGDPRTPTGPKDYSAIYAGLLGQVMEYQKV